MLRIILGVFLGTVLIEDPAWAIKMYRCKGRIQYRACEEPIKKNIPSLSSIPMPTISKPNSAADLSATVTHSNVSDPFARVISEKFDYVTKRDGIWRGLIEGNGLVSLTLELSSQGETVERRPMGSVFLKDTKTTFAFRSALPKVEDWSWRILTQAR